MRSWYQIPPLQRLVRTDRLIIAAILAAFAGLYTSGLHDLGIGWDEHVYFNAGRGYLQWILKPRLVKLDSAWEEDDEHPPLQKVAAAATEEIFSERLHWCSPVVGYRLSLIPFLALLLGSTYWLARQFTGRFGAILSCAILPLLPRVFYQGHLLSLDFTAMSAWAFCAAMFWRDLAGRHNPRTMGAVLAFGELAKLNVVLAIVPWIVMKVLIWARSPDRALGRVEIRATLRSLAWFALFFSVITIAGWPWLWHLPLIHFRDFVAYHLTHAKIPAIYFGKVYFSAPWHYPYVMLMVTLPIGMAAAFLLGVGLFAKRPRPLAAFVFLNFLIPCLAIQLSPAKYDVVRLFLPAFPFVAMIAASGIVWALDRLNSRISWKPLPALGLIAVAAYLGLQVRRYYPYPDSYFSEAIGGLRGAERLGFDIHLWGDALKGVMPWVEKHPAGKYWVTCEGAFLAYYEFGEFPFKPNVVSDPSKADYLVIVNRAMEPSLKARIAQLPELFSVRKDGVSLISIYGKSDIPLVH